jgi:hypothetical protein
VFKRQCSWYGRQDNFINNLKKRMREMKTQALSICLQYTNVYNQTINYKVGVLYAENRTLLKMDRSASVPLEPKSYVSDKHCCCQDQGLNGKLALG